MCVYRTKKERKRKEEREGRTRSDWREVMRSVRPEEIQDTIGRKRKPFEDDAMRRLDQFAPFSFFFFLLLVSIKSKIYRDHATRDWLRILTYVNPITFYRYYCLACSRECSTIVPAARNCATMAIVFCACPATFWKTH